MCLAKAYIRPVDDRSLGNGQAPGANGSVLVMENVAQVEIEGDELRLRSLFGDTQSVHGRIVSIDFGEGRLIVQCEESLVRVEA